MLIDRTIILLLMLLPLTLLAESFEISCGNQGEILKIGGTSLKDAPKIKKPLALERTCSEIGSCLSTLGGVVKLDNRMMEILNEYEKSFVDSFKTRELNQNLERLRSVSYSCRQTRSQYSLKSKDPNFSLSYSLRGPNREKANKGYELSKIDQIVEEAIAKGVDPFAALGIVIMENPPIPSSKTDNYAKSYGLIPVDAIVIGEALNCFEKRPDNLSGLKHNDKKDVQRGMVLAQQLSKINDELMKMPKRSQNLWMIAMNISYKLKGDYKAIPKMNSEELCALANPEERNECSQITKQVRAQLKMIEVRDELDELSGLKGLSRKMGSKQSDELLCMVNKNNCYGYPTLSKPERSFSANSGKEVRRFCSHDTSGVRAGGNMHFFSGDKRETAKCCFKVEGADGLNSDYLEGKIKNSIGLDFISSRIKPKGLDDLSYQLQKFNGLGCFGCSEKMQNSCLEGMHLGDRPIYGARVADLMINMLMNNPELVERVVSESLVQKKPIRSLLCAGIENQSVTIDRERFLEEQKDYLLRGSEKKYKSKFKSGEIARPTDEDMDLYKKREDERKKACVILFLSTAHFFCQSNHCYKNSKSLQAS